MPNFFSAEDKPDLVLGTAMWGWTISQDTAFALLDNFYAAGFTMIDAATNYPINKQAQDFRKAEKILLEWIRVNGVTDLKIMMKVGSINNLRTPENNLNPSFLLMCLDEYRHLLGSNLWGFMIHWDNREDAVAIRDTLEILAFAAQLGIRPGLSGIKFPHLYAKINQDFNLDFAIQIKHNLLQSDYTRYSGFFKKRQFFAYGINGGGINPNPAAYHKQSSLLVRGGSVDTPPIFEAVERELLGTDSRLRSVFDVNLLFALYSSDVAGILLGPSKPEQLQYTLEAYHTLTSTDSTDLYTRLMAIKARYDEKH